MRICDDLLGFNQFCKEQNIKLSARQTRLAYQWFTDKAEFAYVVVISPTTVSKSVCKVIRQYEIAKGREAKG